MGFQAAKCPECGADIQVPSDRNTVKCMYCGKDIIVRQAVAAIGGPPIENLIQLARAAEDAGNRSEAFAYWTRALEVDPTNADAWLGKAISAGWQSDLIDDRLTEMISGVEKALELAGTRHDSLASEAATGVLEVVQAYYGLSIDHTMEFITVDTSWPEHIERSLSMIIAMQQAIEWSPKDLKVHTETLAIVDALLKGIEYPKGEFSEGYEYLNVPDEMRPRLETVRADIITRIKGLDSSFVAKSVKPVKGPGCGCILAVIGIAIVVLLVILVALGKLSTGSLF